MSPIQLYLRICKTTQMTLSHTQWYYQMYGKMPNSAYTKYMATAK